MDCDELTDELLSAQGSAGIFVRKRWNGDARCAGPRSLRASVWTRASAAKTPWKARCIGRWRPSQTVLGNSIHCRSDWRSGRCRNRETVFPLRGEAWCGDDEDAGVCSAPALCGDSVHVFSQSRPKTSQRLLLTSRPTRLSGIHLAVLPASSTAVMACSWHR